MKCFVCNGKMAPYFVKKHPSGLVSNYYRCSECGLTIDKTIYEMSEQERVNLNNFNHSTYQGMDFNVVDPKWIPRLEKQSEFINQLLILDIISSDMTIVDYGCGDGKLAKFVNEKCNMNLISNYDKYMKISDVSYLTDDDMSPNMADMVITCSVWEHLIGKNDVENIYLYLKEDGIFCIHTLIAEEIPKDEDWFYINTNGAHCTLWTNEAMKIWFKTHGFVGCIYHLESQMWLLFKSSEKFNKLKNSMEKISGTVAVSNEFVDYWKQKPYRK
ncbi:MAG: methyltransferase domain-containing protein [Selenomonadaceae bacterium]|nr:methyltransferase domain-containing protein [Selenomonadaceae bacterium]